MKFNLSISSLEQVAIACLALLLILSLASPLVCSPLYDYETVIEVADDDRLSLPTFHHSNDNSRLIQASSSNSNPIPTKKNNEQLSKSETSVKVSSNKNDDATETTSANNQAKSPNTNSNKQAKIDKRQQQQPERDEYLIGLGLADITGPAADVNLVSLLDQLADQLGNFLGLSSPSTSTSSATQPATSTSSSSQTPLSPLVPLLPSSSFLLPSSPRRNLKQENQALDMQILDRSDKPNSDKQQQQQTDLPQKRQQQQQQQTNPTAASRPADGALNTGLSELDSNNFRLFNNLIVIEHPSFNELTQIKLRFRINLRHLNIIQSYNPMNLRWAMPNQVKMQAEYTYANLVVQL